MIPVPDLTLSGSGVHLMPGAKLNALVAAVQARTQLDATETGPRGVLGQAKKGGGVAPPKFRPRFDDKRVYVLSPSFRAKLARAINARQPREGASKDGSGWNTGGAGVLPPMVKPGSTGPDLDATLRALRGATPRDAAETSPCGYRFQQDERTPRQAGIKLEIQTRWAEAFFCRGIFQSSTSTIYTSSTSTANYANGSITTTSTQPNVGPKIWTPGNPIPTCDSVVTTDNRIPGFNYGALISTTPLSYSGAVSASSAYSTALGAVDDDGAPVPYDWTWWEYSAPPSLLFNSYISARWSNTIVGDYYVAINRYRWSNTGNLHVNVDWTEGGSAHTELLAPGDVTGWRDGTLPTTNGAAARIQDIVFSMP